MEKRFARYASEGRRLPYWSVRNDHFWTSRDGNPLRKRSAKGKRYTSDVDFTFANGNKIIFVDVKGYSSSKFYWNLWFMDDYRIREGLFKYKKDKKEQITSLSRSMSMATEQYRELLPDADIKSILLFVPVGKMRGGANYQAAADPRQLPSSVFFLRAPGNIRSYKIEEGFREIRKHLGTEEIPVPVDIQNVLDSHAVGH